MIYCPRGPSPHWTRVKKLMIPRLGGDGGGLLFLLLRIRTECERRVALRDINEGSRSLGLFIHGTPPGRPSLRLIVCLQSSLRGSKKAGLFYSRVDCFSFYESTPRCVLISKKFVLFQTRLHKLINSKQVF